MASVLRQELETFERELPRMLADPRKKGRFALIHGSDVHDTYPNFEDALADGYDKFGLDAFLVREIVEQQEPVYFSRNIDPCR